MSNLTLGGSPTNPKTVDKKLFKLDIWVSAGTNSGFSLKTCEAERPICSDKRLKVFAFYQKIWERFLNRWTLAWLTFFLSKDYVNTYQILQCNWCHDAYESEVLWYCTSLTLTFRYNQNTVNALVDSIKIQVGVYLIK